MVIHYQPGRLRRNSDQPTAITNVLVATSGSSHRTGGIQLGVATCSACSRYGLWALYPTTAPRLWSSGRAVPWPDRPPRSPVSSSASAVTGTTTWTAPPSARSGSS